MFRLVLGTSKSGKTEYLQRYLSAYASSGVNKLLMLVPDQYTFETEKAFLSILGPRDAMNVTVLGFSRLCDYVIEQTGNAHGVLADESVRTLLMSIALEDTADSMLLYGEKAHTPKMLSTMLSHRRDFMRNKVTPELLLKIKSDNNPVLHQKLHDISLTLSAFDALLGTSFDDPEGKLGIVSDILSENNIFDGYIICVDSYLTFSEVELDILTTLMQGSKEMLVALSDDNNAGEGLFSVPHSTGVRLLARAKEAGVKINDTIVCDYDGFFSNTGLSHIEKNIFRDNTLACEKISVDNSSVMIYGAKDRYDECDFVARNIRRLIIEEGYRYNDIAVVCRSISPYAGLLNLTLDRYDIPYFSDTPSQIHSKPLMKLISACFECVTTSFHKDAVLSVIKSGLTSVDTFHASLFENYLFTWNISGSKLFTEFTANPRGFADNTTTDDLLELSRVELTRKQIIEPLLTFRDEIKSSTAEQICKALYKLLIALGADKRVVALADELSERGEHQLSEEQIRLWQMLIDTIDRTIAVIGQRVIKPQRFSELLKLQFSAQDIAFIPKALDQVIVGDIDRLRLTDKKAVFVIGAVEGEFPLVPDNGGLFTGSERALLTEEGILRDKTPEILYSKEKYLCYYALTSGSEKLFVSYPMSTMSGTSVTPSVIIGELSAMFTDLKVLKFSDLSSVDFAWGSKPSFNLFATRFGSTDDFTTALDKYFTENVEFANPRSALLRAVNRDRFRITDSTVATSLFGSNMYLSASQVEKYHLCRFMYFCTYGLRVQERRTAQIDAMEYGSFVHYILEHFIKNYSKTELCSLTSEEISSKVKSVMSDYADTHFGGLEDKSDRFTYLYSRVSFACERLITHMAQELAQSSFVPEEFELEIGEDVPAYTLTLPTGQTITIRGKVDRADLMRKDGKTYIRIIDYKTGTKVFSLSDIMYGLNLQMLIYLSALTRKGGERFGDNLIPAGVLYMPSVVPFIDATFSDSLDSIESRRNKKLCMNGLILSDLQVIEAMERDCGGIYIPVSSKGDNIKGTDNLASLEEFGAIFSYIDKMIAEMAVELQKGNIHPNPAAVCYDACEYCPYFSVCGHKEDDVFRNVYKLDRREILKELGLDENSEEVLQ